MTGYQFKKTVFLIWLAHLGLPLISYYLFVVFFFFAILSNFGEFGMCGLKNVNILKNSNFTHCPGKQDHITGKPGTT